MDATINVGSSRDLRQLAGPQRAAAILLAMGKPPATRLLKHLEPHELREVTRAAARPCKGSGMPQDGWCVRRS